MTDHEIQSAIQEGNKSIWKMNIPWWVAAILIASIATFTHAVMTQTTLFS